MSSVAASERALLCGLAQQLGPDAPTLCEGWTVNDLVAHLVVREGSPAAAGLVVPALSGVLERARVKRREEEFEALVERLRQGPPFYSPFRLPKVGSSLNLLEFYVHHEDVRRAQPTWEPRSLPRATEDGIWRSTRVAGRGLVSRCGVGVVAERSDTGGRADLRKGDRQVVVRGLPSEVALYLHGRKEQARVELGGSPADVTALWEARLGF